MNVRRAAALSAALLLAAGTLRADPPTLAPGRAAGPIVLDGRLDEAAWAAAPASTAFVWLGTYKKENAPAKTSFRILRDDDAVWFGILLDEPKMAAIKDTAIVRDSSVFDLDCFEIFVDPEGRGVNYYQFAVSAANTQWDQYWIEGGNTTIGEYNGLWESAIHKDKTFWSAEVRIPLTAFFHTPATAFSDAWRINVTRERKPEYELTSWAATAKGFHEPLRFGRVPGLPRKSPALDVRIVRAEPAVTAKTAAGYAGGMEVELACADKRAYGPYEISLSADGRDLGRKTVSCSSPKTTAVIDGLSFPELKWTTFTVALAAGGKPAGGTVVFTELKYEPLVVTVNEPFYANCIFPEQTVRAVRGTIRINMLPGALKNPRADVSLSGNGFEKRAVLPVTGREVPFSLDVSAMKEGTYALSCRILSAGAPVAERSVTIRKLPKSRGGSVYIDRDLNLVVDGAPMHVRGWYGSEGYLVSEALLKNSPHPDSRYVNTWNCWIGIEAERLDAAEKDRIKNHVRPSQKVYDGMKATIEKNRDNPKLRFYYLCDEPECRGVSPVYLKYQYDYIKEMDPYRPVMIISRSPEKYTECADILNPHPYLNPTVDARGARTMRSPKHIRETVRTVYTAGGMRIPAWCTPQAFSYSFIDPEADNPTFPEYRCMMYTALANGCKGFTPFLYNSHFESPGLRVGCDYVYEEMADLEPFLLGSPESDPVKVSAPDDGVDVWIRAVGGRTLVVAVNLLDRPVAATVESPALKSLRTLFGYREKGTLAVKNGAATISFPAYGVRLFTVPEMSAGKRSVADALADVEKAEKALKKPGNILYGRGREIEWDASDTYIATRTLFTLTDGICDAFGWKDVFGRQPARIDAIFPTFVPRFRTAKFYTSTVEDLDFYIWKAGDWAKVGEVRGNKEPVVTFTFPERLSTVKMRIMMPKAAPGKRAELYEIELYE